MESISKIYKIGYGPSSSHTMGPAYACQMFLNNNLQADKFKVTLYGSLAMTGRGHMTDYVIKQILGEHKCEIEYDYETTFAYHPNAMRLKAYQNKKIIAEDLIFSIGGGDIRHLDEDRATFSHNIYPHQHLNDILQYCQENQLTLVDYIRKFEEPDIDQYIEKVYQTMKTTIQTGLLKEGELPGGLKVQRKACEFYQKYLQDGKEENLQYAYALATSEENASGGIIVTAPTCGSCGVVPSVLAIQEKIYQKTKKDIINALLIGGLIANIVKTNSSISGAEVGCQGEIGVACSMAASILAYLKGGSNQEIEYAAEIALEHHLGMTCDPIDGLVQIPCIERNAIASFTAKGSAEYALIAGGKHYVTFDRVVEVMKETGKDLHSKYRETSLGGLALKKTDKDTTHE